MTEHIWHSNADFCTPEQLRLQCHLRTRKFKSEMSNDLGGRLSAMQVLAENVSSASDGATAAPLLLSAKGKSLDAPPRIRYVKSRA
eukprot:5143482-Pleurochrysis_carterae.AAC.1